MIDGHPAKLIVPRDRRVAVERALRKDKCAVLYGPYKAGKSALATTIREGSSVETVLLNLKDRAIREEFQSDLTRVVNNSGRLLILDDVHLVPDCLDLIRQQCERYRNEGIDIGQFLLLGAAPLTRTLITENDLGTRCEASELAPIHLLELIPKHDSIEIEAFEVEAMSAKAAPRTPLVALDQLWLRGGFPESLFADADSSRVWRERYLTDCYNRAIPGLDPSQGAGDVAAFFQSVAEHHSGEYLQKKHLIYELRMCVGHFERAGIIRRVWPWPEAINGEESPYPKIYIRDSGLFHALRQLWTLDDVRADDKVYGASWEGFCVENLIAAAGDTARASHFRASMAKEKDEVDLILRFDNALVVLEFKAGDGRLSQGFFDICEALKPTHRIAIRNVDESYVTKGVTHTTLLGAVQMIQAIATHDLPAR